MLRSSGLSTADLIDVCRSIRYALSSGLMLRDVVDLMEKQAGRSVRRVAAGLSKDL